MGKQVTITRPKAFWVEWVNRWHNDVKNARKPVRKEELAKRLNDLMEQLRPQADKELITATVRSTYKSVGHAIDLKLGIEAERGDSLFTLRTPSGNPTGNASGNAYRIRKSRGFWLTVLDGLWKDIKIHEASNEALGTNTYTRKIRKHASYMHFFLDQLEPQDQQDDMVVDVPERIAKWVFRAGTNKQDAGVDLLPCGEAQPVNQRLRDYKVDQYGKPIPEYQPTAPVNVQISVQAARTLKRRKAKEEALAQAQDRPDLMPVVTKSIAPIRRPIKSPLPEDARDPRYFKSFRAYRRMMESTPSPGIARRTPD